MTTKAKTKSALEIRADLAKGIAEVDLQRAEKVKEIFTRPEMAKALEELKAIYDPAPMNPTATAGTDINALIRSGITVLEQMPTHADGHISTQTAILNPPPANPPLAPAPAPASTPEA